MFNFLKQDKDGNLVDFFIDYVTNYNALSELALEIGVNRIADVIAKCGFSVYSKENEEEAKDIEYTLNVKPNVNQNATDFWKQAVSRMIKNDEGCLIVKLGTDLFIADSWDCNDNVTKERIYSNVTIIVDDDTFTLKKKFKSSDVVHLRYSNPRLIKLLKQSNELNEKGWNVALNGFKAKAPKIKVSIPAQLKIQDKDGKILTSNEYAEQVAKKLSDEEIKAIVSSSGIDISTIDMKNSLTTNDIKILREEIFTTTAIALGIPKSVFYGEASDNNDEFITYACEPIINIIDNAVNGAWLTKEEYIKGNRIYINRLNVKHIDVIDSANNLDKLYSNGWSFNDVLKLLNQPIIDENWANERRFTKNYSANIEGGENT